MAIKEKAKTTKNLIKDVEIIEPQKNKAIKTNIKKEDKKGTKLSNKKVAKKKGIFTSIGSWFKSVIKELKNVKWPTKKEMIKNSIATIVFILFFGVFFLLVEVLVSLLLEYFG